MRAIICKDKAEWQALEDHVHQAMLDDGENQDEWSTAKIHPVDGRIAFQVKSRILQYLSEDEIERIVELPESWTPITEEF